MKLDMVRQLSMRFSPPKNQEDLQRIWEVLQQEGVQFQNFYQELEMSHPMVETHQDESFTNDTMTLHSHNFYELLFCRSCDRVEYLVGTERYRLCPGDIIMVAPGISHRPLLPEDMKISYQRDIVWISETFAELLPRLLPGSRLVGEIPNVVFLRTGGTRWEFLKELFRNGVKEAEWRKPEYEGVVLGNTLSILSQIARAMDETSVSQLKAEKPELLDKVMAYIEAHLGEKITLEETAKNLYVSVSTITQLFRQKMGVSFHRCVTQRRLIAAKNLIAEGVGLEQISDQIGFSDYSSFYRAFKQEYGISPRQYKKLQQPNGE